MSKALGLQPREKLFRAIVDYKLAHDGNSPSIRELCSATGFSSTSTVNYHLRALERAGRIILGNHYRHNSICVVGGQWLFEPELLPEYRGVELPSGAVAHVSMDVSPETLAALDQMIVAAVEQVAQEKETQ